MESTEQHMNRI